MKACLGILIFALLPALASAEVKAPLLFENVSQEDMTNLRSPSLGLNLQKPSLADADEAIRVLFLTGKYESIELQRVDTPKGDEYRVVARPARIIRKIRISGNSEIDDSEISSLLGVSVDDRFTRSQFQPQIEALKALYQERGHSNAQVAVTHTEEKDGTVSLAIDINEGAPTLLTSIVVESQNSDLQRQTSNFLDRYRGRKMTDALLARIRDELRDRLNANQFWTANVQIHRTSVPGYPLRTTLRIIIDNPYAYSLSFSNRNPFDDFTSRPPGKTDVSGYNLPFSYSDLLRALNISNQDRFGANLAAELSDRLRTFLRKRGYAHATVSAQEAPSKIPFQKRILMEVQEGPVVVIAGIEFSGRTSLGQQHYEELMVDSKGSKVTDSPFVAEELEKALANLTVSLQNEGHLKAKVLSSRTEFSRDRRTAKIYVFLDEGPVTRLKTLRFSGNKTFSAQELNPILGLNQGAELRLNVLEEGLVRLREYYLARGYLDFQVLNEKDAIEYSDDNSEATLNLELKEGPLVRVGSVLVEGNTITDSSVILKETELVPGEVLTLERIDDIENRLERLGLFSGVRVDTLEKGTNLEWRTVIIRVSDRNPGLFNTGVGSNNELNTNEVVLKTYMGIAYRNLRGKGRAISARGELQRSIRETTGGFIEYSVNVGYLEPFLFGKRIRGRANLLRQMEITQQSTDSIKALETNELGLNLEKDFSKKWKFTWSLWNFASTRTFAVKGDLEETKVNIGSFGPTIEWENRRDWENQRENVLNPSRGTYFSTQLEYSNPFIGSSRTIHYWKASSTFNSYVPLLQKTRLIWATSFRGGYESNLSQLQDGAIPDVKRFALGGRSSLRAFDPDTVPYEEEVKYKSYLPSTGGHIPFTKSIGIRMDSQFYLARTEIQFPIWGDVVGALFYDGGGVKITGVDLEDEYRDGWGIGIRILTPVGPLSFDLARKLDTRENWRPSPESSPITESPWRFNFYIGAF